ncbi:MAG: FTR1 family iron permease [Clostridia bacterium]|nr:FTR1 family iron permease [Clostridia bacterium]
MSLSWEKRLASLMLLLALLLSLMLPCFALAEDSDAQLDPTRWGNAADRIDRYADTAFALYMAGDFAKAYSNVSDAYFQVYEITGFERQTLSYISGPRKNAVELQFSTCKAAVKKSNEDEETQKEVRTALVKLKTMIREDANKLATKDGEPVTEMSYWLDGQKVDYDPWADLAGDPNATVHYASWSAAYDAIAELLDTAYTGYKGKDFEAAIDNVNTSFYTVYEESGLSHKLYSDLSLEDREAVDAQYATVKGIIGGEKFQSKAMQRETKKLKNLISAKATRLDEKAEAEKAEQAALAQAEAAQDAEAQSDPRLLTFLGAFGIIVREGLEAILVIAAIIAYLTKSGNAKNLKNVYVGAVLGIVASFVAAAILAWAKAAWAGAGQSQEVIEGITALIAVCVLFYVSNWMISKAEAASWSRYIDDKVQSSVERGSSFALAFTAFLSVFREGAEVVLFYQPMLSEGNPGMVWAGFGAGCVVLVFVYLAITKLSIKLPIKVFFTATSILMAIMCVSFLGSGIKELAEGNVFDVTLQVPGIPENDVLQVLGIYPYLETLVPQLILAIILLITFMIAHYRGKMDALRKELSTAKT